MTKGRGCVGGINTTGALAKNFKGKTDVTMFFPTNILHHLKHTGVIREKLT